MAFCCFTRRSPPVILADREAFLDVWISGFECERKGVVYGGPTMRREEHGEAKESECKLWKCFHNWSGRGGRNRADEVMDDIANLVHGLLRNIGIGFADEWSNFRKPLLNLRDHFIAPQPWRHAVQLMVEVVEKSGLVKQSGAVLRIIAIDDLG